MGGDWFENLFGFRERDADVRKTLTVEDGGAVLASPINGARYGLGAFSTPSLAGLRAAVRARSVAAPRPSTFTNVVGDAGALHARGGGATFQVASQFNCLEFVGPSVVPEQGVTGYAADRTQGPCCAIACGAATVYRNYFYDGGQTRDRQIENLRPLLAKLGPPAAGAFRVEGGYTMAYDAALRSYGAAISVEIKMFRIRSTWSIWDEFGERYHPDLEISRRDDHRSKNEPKRPHFERARAL